MLNIVILAAGQGTRMRSAQPKVLHAIAGQPMLAHVLNTARALEPGRIVVVVGHGAEQVQQAFSGQGLQFALQQPQQGTGHAVMQAMPLLAGGADDACLVLYGDVPLVQASTLQALLRVRGLGGLALLTETMADPTGYGRIVRDGRGRIMRIVEHKDATPEEQALREVNTGILAAPLEPLRRWLGRLGNDNAQAEYYLTDIVGLAVADGVAVSHAQPAESWETLGVNSRVQQAGLERIWQGVQAQRLLEQGVSLADPARLDVRGTLDCGRDVRIDVGCVFEGTVRLGDGVQVGPNCVLRNADIGTDTVIEAFSHIEGARVAQAARIGPYARLRPGADVGPEAHVGNFVELKQTRLGRGSKANHLAYLGDARIGERVNIGAGTITCNYDGVNKLQTVIDDDAFIGSDTQLVAPVHVGAGATLGAGTTLVRDAPAGQLTLSRPRQDTIPGWSRPKRKS
ncbi:bifunctional UDP-N-acetylglucosamine diphosphorylase/glucosamine-1-phosphate N-acetyltransferase GlmU [Castellaniella sp.]|uniref:bifunctional UDP-N-acetylglucosamine diphosphorylase/glucosamine-1-phosphate N-acetyltransferase GlmU n=1 Tax=Castellaniella sp. TaxID=1955812 RepID=UPI00355F054F